MLRLFASISSTPGASTVASCVLITLVHGTMVMCGLLLSSSSRLFRMGFWANRWILNADVRTQISKIRLDVRRQPQHASNTIARTACVSGCDLRSPFPLVWCSSSTLSSSMEHSRRAAAQWMSGCFVLPTSHDSLDCRFGLPGIATFRGRYFGLRVPPVVWRSPLLCVWRSSTYVVLSQLTRLLHR